MAKAPKQWKQAELDAWAKREFSADFKPEPTVFTGGIDRMIKLWEASRDCNDGGYGSGVIQSVRHWGSPSPSKVTSCSPFTATVIGMMFDDSGNTDASATYQPKFDGGTALPVHFYALHNGYYFNDPEDNPTKKIGTARKKWFHANKWPTTANCSSGSLEFFNLGYEIDPRDMRRGDLIAINWANKGGHATFCWDVHLDASGAVDCFLFLSSNGCKGSKGYAGAGVSVGTTTNAPFFDSAKKPFKKKGTMFEDKPEYIEFGKWECLPHVKKQSVDTKTFKGKAPSLKHNIIDSSNGGHSVASLTVIRFWGFAPPEAPHGKVLGDKADLARQLTKWQSPPPYAVGSSTPSEGRIENVTATKVPKSEPEPTKAVAAAPAQQKKEQVVGHQLFVEQALAELFHAEWIEKDPGTPDAVADSQSKAAIEDFQTKWKLESVDGKAGPKTRAALKKALEDLHDGKPNPHPKTPPKAAIAHIAWAKNKVEQGGTCKLTVSGEHLDLVKSYEVALTDKKTGKSQTVSVQIVAKSGHGSESVTIPDVFSPGSQLTTKVSGGGAQKSTDVLLYVAAPAVAQSDDWIWDEKKWPASMTDQLKHLRLVQQQVNRSYTARKITQYGVWDRITPGDTAVLDKNGREIGQVDRQCLYMADLEGTMRLDGRILNLIASGNVFDPQMGRAPFEKFNPRKSRWVDVTDRAPWGMGAQGPLIPFRTLAHNAAKESGLYGKKVFVEQLTGLKLPTGEVHNGMCVIGDSGAMEPGKQFDLFVGPESKRIALPAQCNVEILR